jgi:kynurenine formamidase
LYFHFIGTGIAKDAAEYIAEKRQVYGVGVDTPSLDPGQNVVFDAHRTLFEAQMFGIENLKLVKDVLPGNYTNLLNFRFSHMTPS